MNPVRYDTDKQKNYSNRYKTISKCNTWKLSFSSCVKKTGMPGDGGENTFDAIQYIKTSQFDISNTFDAISIDEKLSVVDKISVFDTSKLKRSFSVCLKNTGTPGDGEQNTFDMIRYIEKRYIYTMVYRYIETFDAIFNTS